MNENSLNSKEILETQISEIQGSAAVSAPVAPAPATPKSHSATGWKITTFIFALLAVAGLGFGVFELLDSNQKSADLAAVNSSLAAAESAAILSRDYFYFPSLGIKIKKPTDAGISYVAGNYFVPATDNIAENNETIAFYCGGSDLCPNGYNDEAGAFYPYNDYNGSTTHTVLLSSMSKTEYEEWQNAEVKQYYPGDLVLEVEDQVILVGSINLDANEQWQARLDYIMDWVKNNTEPLN